MPLHNPFTHGVRGTLKAIEFVADKAALNGESTALHAHCHQFLREGGKILLKQLESIKYSSAGDVGQNKPTYLSSFDHRTYSELLNAIEVASQSCHDNWADLCTKFGRDKTAQEKVISCIAALQSLQPTIDYAEPRVHAIDQIIKFRRTYFQSSQERNPSKYKRRFLESIANCATEVSAATCRFYIDESCFTRLRKNIVEYPMMETDTNMAHGLNRIKRSIVKFDNDPIYDRFRDGHNYEHNIPGTVQYLVSSAYHIADLITVNDLGEYGRLRSEAELNQLFTKAWFYSNEVLEEIQRAKSKARNLTQQERPLEDQYAPVPSYTPSAYPSSDRIEEDEASPVYQAPSDTYTFDYWEEDQEYPPAYTPFRHNDLMG